MTELLFIDQLKSKILAESPASRNLPIAPGDDCALVPSTTEGVLFAADMLMEGVHFDLSLTTPELVGRKALAVNLSDIASMAGIPTGITVCLALPQKNGGQLGEGIMRGMIDLANKFDVAIAGGDTNAWNGPLVVSVAVIGKPHPKGSVTRGGARPGDWIMVTGKLGGSIYGRHLTFSPRLQEAYDLHSLYGLNAMIDLSDGLATDLRHILAQSRVGARLRMDRIPIHTDCIGKSPDDVPPLERALRDGEDFELLFTVSPAVGAKILNDFANHAKLTVSHIGEITDEPQRVLWENGAEFDLRGYTHAFD
jgi:thiamine-monophosphate kinase